MTNCKLGVRRIYSWAKMMDLEKSINNSVQDETEAPLVSEN